MVRTARNGRRRVLRVWVVRLLFLVAACGGPGVAPTVTAIPTDTVQPATAANPDYGVPKNPKIAALGPVELHVLFAADYYKVAPVVAVADAFMRMYPNVKINLDGTEWDQIPARIKTEIAEGSDSIDLAHQHAFVMGAQGFAEPMTTSGPNSTRARWSPGRSSTRSWKASTTASHST